ncbi:MAG: RHS repeat-associated core domain-containing protein [Candidatus Izemoplasmatales bacterium]|nr:RHS repeat-associated core domain-containing protein [Candidatus Izemoplasmatales bacterium]
MTTIVDENGATIVQYRYDAYGNLTIVSDATEGILSIYNPYTYRGYRYDSEIGMYYLNSRFYNPQIGRFINADGMLGQFGDVQSTNMYAYCANNTVMIIQSTGCGVSVSSLQSVRPNLSANIMNYVFFDYKGNHRNPNQGSPNSIGRIYYPDGTPKQEREYGDDGKPTVDHDHHPGEDVGYDHDHDWIDGKRDENPRFPNKIVAVFGLFIAGIVIVGLVADDLTGVGVSDDVFIPAAVATFASFIIIVFGSKSDTGDEY